VKILYLGNLRLGTTSAQRAEALRRLGHEVIGVDPYLVFQDARISSLAKKIHFRTGYHFIQSTMESWLRAKLVDVGPADVCWVDSGELLGVRALKEARRWAQALVLFNHDDPTGARDGRRFGSLKKALPLYDVCSAVRAVNVGEYQALGARNVVLVTRTYDEVAHHPLQPEELTVGDGSDVAFVGTWIAGEGRDEFILELISLGINVSVWGGRWDRSRHWKSLRHHWRGGALSGRDYVSVIQSSKIALGMLSKGNRDDHTTRSMEIPYIGSLLCAERTDEHRALYTEGEEAVFWSSAQECASLCNSLLEDDAARQRIRSAGHERVLRNAVGNEDVCRKLLKEIR
jgi:spore maturation protein CgeB